MSRPRRPTLCSVQSCEAVFGAEVRGGVSFGLILPQAAARWGGHEGAGGQLGEGKVRSLSSGVVGEGCGDGEVAVIPWPVAQQGFLYGEGSARWCRSPFGGCPSGRAAMPPSLPGAFGGTGFVPTAWSGGGWGIGKGLFSLKN